jgi:isopenicillin-N epimerase
MNDGGLGVHQFKQDQFKPAHFKQHWRLDPNIAFLNHGAFGACPIPVLAAQQELRDRLESQPLQFLAREIEDRLDIARTALAQFLNADPNHLAFIPNATTGINAVLRSLIFQPGDEVVTTNQEYNACRNALDFVAERSGINVRIAQIPYPIADPAEITNAVLNAITPRTQLVLLDHVVSQTAYVMPIPAIATALKAQGIDTLIDGAHAPGMLPLHLDDWDVTYYAGNCHKWLSSPKGAAFLYVHPDRQDQIHPTTISHGRNDPRTGRSRFHLEFDWTGTWDPTAYLSVPTAIDFMGSLLPGGWTELMAHNRSQILAMRQMLTQTLDLPIACPDSMVGSMVTLPIAAQHLPVASAAELISKLWNDYQIELLATPFPDSSQYLLRLSSQIYNQPAEFERLAEVLQNLYQFVN